MHDVDTASLRTFILLAQTGSFSRTGTLIGRSQSAVSTQIQKLEQTLGRVLVKRNSRNVSLTAEGEQLLVHARVIVKQADEMLARFRLPEVGGEVRFGSPEDFAFTYLPEVLAAFASIHPSVELHVTCQLTAQLVEAFEAKKLDLIIINQAPEHRHTGSRSLWRERLVWVASSAVENRFERMNECSLPLILNPVPCVYRATTVEALGSAGIPWKCVFTSPSFAGQAAAARAALGYAVMPLSMVPQDLRVLNGWPEIAEVETALLAQAHLSPAATTLAEFIVERTTRLRMAADS
jgi:DNA-binding transcriptional LysR family regulator